MNAPVRRGLLALGACVLVAVVLVLGARVANRYYHEDTLWGNALGSLSGRMKPGDFGWVFLPAGDAVLAGESPYMDPDEFVGPPQAPYAYPPALALAMAPLALVPEQFARTSFAPGVIFSLLLVAAIVGGLALLGVRDWRCYPVALLAPWTLETVQYGAVGPILVLLVAVMWRYRNRPLIGGLASGATAVLKLFLWPLLFWLAATGRSRAAVTGLITALALALGSWLAIAFRGVLDYPRLLRRLVEVEAENSYSAFAILRTAGVPELAAQGVVLLAGAALLALAWRAARETASTAAERDRRSLTLALAAALVLTPILWLHYLVLLFVPIALARPRLSAIWFFPLVLSVLEWRDWYRGWPRGDVEALVSVAIAVAIVFVVVLRRSRPAVGEQPAEAASA